MAKKIWSLSTMIEAAVNAEGGKCDVQIGRGEGKTVLTAQMFRTNNDSPDCRATGMLRFAFIYDGVFVTPDEASDRLKSQKALLPKVKKERTFEEGVKKGKKRAKKDIKRGVIRAAKEAKAERKAEKKARKEEKRIRAESPGLAAAMDMSVQRDGGEGSQRDGGNKR